MVLATPSLPFLGSPSLTHHCCISRLRYIALVEAEEGEATFALISDLQNADLLPSCLKVRLPPSQPDQEPAPEADLRLVSLSSLYITTMISSLFLLPPTSPSSFFLPCNLHHE